MLTVLLLSCTVVVLSATGEPKNKVTTTTTNVDLRKLCPLC